MGLLIKLQPKKINGRALDVGCAVGGTSFELATHFDEVVGFDFSKAFVDTANLMKENKKIEFEVAMEGRLSTYVQARHEVNVGPAERAKCRFHEGDACAPEQ